MAGLYRLCEWVDKVSELCLLMMIKKYWQSLVVGLLVSLSCVSWLMRSLAREVAILAAFTYLNLVRESALGLPISLMARPTY